MVKEYIEPDGTFSPATTIGHESVQLQKLLNSGVTDDKELAHRMATTVKAVRKMRKFL